MQTYSDVLNQLEAAMPDNSELSVLRELLASTSSNNYKQILLSKVELIQLLLAFG